MRDLENSFSKHSSILLHVSDTVLLRKFQGRYFSMKAAKNFPKITRNEHEWLIVVKINYTISKCHQIFYIRGESQATGPLADYFWPTVFHCHFFVTFGDIISENLHFIFFLESIYNLRHHYQTVTKLLKASWLSASPANPNDLTVSNITLDNRTTCEVCCRMYKKVRICIRNYIHIKHLELNNIIIVEWFKDV